MTPHNSAKKEDIAKTVIMPGDPKRAKFIAENFLENPVLVNDVRMALCYTGTYKGKKVSVMSSGMGMPSMGIYSYELFNFYEVDNIIRLGSCQSRRDDIVLSDIIVATSAYTDSNFAFQMSGNGSSVVEASSSLGSSIEIASERLGLKINEGPIWTSDIFYREKELQNEEITKCIGLEMESFALFYIAKKLGKEAISILTVSDSMFNSDSLTAEEREKSFKNAATLALESII